MLAPIANPNKMLDDLEHKVYQKKVRYILLVEGGGFLSSILLHLQNLIVIIIMNFGIVSVILIVGKVALIRRK